MRDDLVLEHLVEFGIRFARPDWWDFKLEDAGDPPTYLYWDEYTGSFRITPQRAADGDAAAFLALTAARAAASQRLVFGAATFVCYVEDRGGTRLHCFVTAIADLRVVCSFAYDRSLLDDELATDEVEGALEEVTALLHSMSFAG